MKTDIWRIKTFIPDVIGHKGGMALIPFGQCCQECTDQLPSCFRIHADGTYESGNGWLQSSKGTWTFDPQQQTFKPTETLGLKDEFGPFSVSFNDEQMIWKRTEEDIPVVVTLEQISQLPKGPADQITGLWGLTKMSKAGEEQTATFDPDGKHYRFFRWDRIYVERTTEGQRFTGYWHMHGHRPEITLLSHRDNIPPETWRVSTTDTTCTLTGVSETNKGVVLEYERLGEFPQ